jgi:Na+-transporting NADH:ubiquinone oxidoreductase subunit F
MLIFTSIVAFTAVILLLVGLLIFAQKKLVQSGPVKIVINGEKTITVSAGSSLLSTLANEKIFLPSACGGGGTCAMCKCVVESGGGDVLPTEVGHLTRMEQKEKVRLGCQVKVKQDLNHSDP